MLEIRNADGSRTDNLLHQLREDAGGLWLFLAHSREPYHKDIPRKQEIRITVNGEYRVRLFDTQTGAVCPVKFSAAKGKTVICAALYDLDSLLLRLDPGAEQDRAVHRPGKAGSGIHVLPVSPLVEYSLEEPNVLLLDKAEFALDDEPYQPAQELLRADNVLREKLGWPCRKGATAQPWTVPKEIIEHSVRLRFTVESTLEIDGIRLALEDAEVAAVVCNDRAISAQPDGWFTDRSIGTLPIGSLYRGQNVIEIMLPFGRRTNVEWCYLLGSFGVRLAGEYRELVKLPGKLGFDNVVLQQLPYYGSNITYFIPVETTGRELWLTVSHYDGAAVRVVFDDGVPSHVIYPPYRISLGRPAAGKHLLKLTLLGNRENCFGPLHNADLKNAWIGPDAWRTEGAEWTDSYRLTSLGIRTAPLLEETDD